MRPTVLLFDIDGTLITTGGAGRRAIERAFAKTYGREDAFRGLNFGGMTDRAIVRHGLTAIGKPADDAAIDALLAEYVATLAEEVAKASDYRVHAGMHEALDATCGRAGFAVGLGTGNIRAGAKVKLERVGIHERFTFGGFGCDHEDRTELIRRGAERGAGLLKAPLAECRVVIIGDTPKDISAAKGIGAESVAVATGGFKADDLAACNPTLTVPDLAAPGALAHLLGG